MIDIGPTTKKALPSHERWDGGGWPPAIERGGHIDNRLEIPVSSPHLMPIPMFTTLVSTVGPLLSLCSRSIPSRT